MRRLEGKVALVTGAGARGAMGEAHALRLAAEGAAVVVSDIEQSPVEIREDGATRLWEGTKSVAEAIEATGGRALPLNFNIRAENEVNQAVARIMTHLGHVDILVNNAAGANAGDRVPTVELALAEWNRVIETNLTGTFLVTKAVAGEMIRAGKGGKIIMISSQNGRYGKPNSAAYSSSKFGIIGLTQVLARELGKHKINVNAVCPGTIKTPRLEVSARFRAAKLGIPWEEELVRSVEERARALPLGRLGTPEDVANLIAFLASSESDFITGQAIMVDGGFVMI